MRRQSETPRRQKAVKGGRSALPSCVLGRIKDRVERDARLFHVSKSFVVAVALAHTFGIEEQEEYR